MNRIRFCVMLGLCLDVAALLACKRSPQIDGKYEARNVRYEVDVNGLEVPYPNMRVRTEIARQDLTIEVRDADGPIWRCVAETERDGTTLRNRAGSGKCQHLQFGGCYPGASLLYARIEDVATAPALDLFIYPHAYSDRCPDSAPDQSVRVRAPLERSP